VTPDAVTLCHCTERADAAALTEVGPLPFEDLAKAGAALARDPRNPAIWAYLDQVRAAL
jgi:hypothetical protein